MLSDVIALVVALVSLFLTGALYHLPMAVLAAIIFAALRSMMNFSRAKQLWSISKIEFFQWLVAFACTTFLGVTYGIFAYEPPAGVWEGEIPGVSPAVGATVLLTGVFFLVYFFQAVARTYSQYVGGNAFVGKFETSMQRAADTMGMAPMLCALFLAARMRALQMDPVSGHPQRWAQGCFYGCAGAIVTQSVVAIIVPLLLNGSAKKRADVEGDMEYDVGTAVPAVVGRAAASRAPRVTACGR